MGKLDQQSNLRQLPGDRGGSQEPSGTFCCPCPVALRWISQQFSLRCVLVLVLGLAVFLSAVFWIIPMRSKSLGFDAKDYVKLSATVQASFKLEKPASELVTRIGRLEYDIYGEIGAPFTKVAVLSIHQAGSSNYSNVVFGVLSDPLNVPIDQVSLVMLKLSMVDLFLQLSNLTLTTSVFGQTSDFQILKFPGGVTVVPMQADTIWQIPQTLFNFSLNNSISDIEKNSAEFREQLKDGLHLKPYEHVYLRVTNDEGSTLAASVTVQASVMSDLGILLPERLKELVNSIKSSPSNLGLTSQFGKVKSVILSNYLKKTIEATSPSPSPAPSPGPCYQLEPSPSPTPAPSSSPGMKPRTPPSRPPQAHRPFSPGSAPQISPSHPKRAGPPAIPPRAYAPASPTKNRGNAKNSVSPSLAPLSSSWAVGPSHKEVWLLGFSAFLIHLLWYIH